MNTPTVALFEPVLIWAVSDGRAGIANQVLGLAESVADILSASGLQSRVETRQVRFKPWAVPLPNWLKTNPTALLDPASDKITAPWPDIWIGAGRASLPFSRRIREWSGGKSLVVQCQNPRMPLAAFDLIVAPAHDGLTGDSVISLIGSTHRVTRPRLNQALLARQADFAKLKGPRVVVLVGGASKSHNLSPKRAHSLVNDIRAAVGSVRGSLLMSVSRRTPPVARQILLGGLKDVRGEIYDGVGENPYFAYLAAADYILVTEDSVNMATEAAATGKPVFLLKMDARRPGERIARFHQGLIDYGAARWFDGQLRGFRYPPLEETQRAARAVFDIWSRHLTLRLRPLDTEY